MRELQTLRVADGSAEFSAEIEQAARAWHDDLVVIDNHTVFALAGNANDLGLQDRIVEVKGDQRGSKQPVGWTRFFDERMLDTIDVDVIENCRMQELLRKPERLTTYLGGLSFIRAQADKKAKERHGVPDSIIPPVLNGDVTTVQMYSPAGVATTSAITRRALELGVETVMTSANRSGVPESVTETSAAAFINEGSPDVRPVRTLVVCRDPSVDAERPRGSYPVIVAKRDHFSIKRFGCFTPEILMRVLHEYPVRIPQDAEKTKFPDNVLRMQDLPADVQHLKGPEFRLGMLSALGWSQERNPAYVE
jgi:hypothetical protein